MIAPSGLLPSKTNQSGSALVYVFIGVVLFGALALTFARSLNGPVGEIDSKTAKVGSSEIVEYMKGIDRAVNKMVLHRVSETDIGFTNTVTTLTAGGASYYSGNTNCATDDCEVFSNNGGKVKAMLPSSSYLIDNSSLSASGPMAGAVLPYVVNISGTGSASPELVMAVYGLKDTVCQSINTAFKIDTTSGAIPTEDNLPASTLYTGDLTSSTVTLGDGATVLEGKNDFCYQISGSTPATNVYIHVLIAR